MAASKSKTALGLAVGLFLLDGCERYERPDHEKLTVTVTADGVDYTGSAVRDYQCWHGEVWPFGSQADCHVRGDAVVIPIGKARYAFLTIDRPYGAAMARPYDFAVQNSDTELWTVPLDKAPQLVQFRNIRDPASVEAILPRSANPLAPIVFKSLTVEIVEDGAELGEAPRYLPWFARARQEKWGNLKGQGGVSDNDLASHLYYGDFEADDPID